MLRSPRFRGKRQARIDEAEVETRPLCLVDGGIVQGLHWGHFEGPVGHVKCPSCAGRQPNDARVRPRRPSEWRSSLDLRTGCLGAIVRRKMATVSPFLERKPCGRSLRFEREATGERGIRWTQKSLPPGERVKILSRAPQRAIPSPCLVQRPRCRRHRRIRRR